MTPNPPSKHTPNKTNDTGVTVRLADVAAERVSWLWQRRIPRGKLSVLDGDPGLGKTTLMVDTAARVTRGLPMPDGTPCLAGGVVIATAEDGLGDTIRPRCEAAGADLRRIIALTGIAVDGGERLPELPADMPAFESAIREVGAVLVVIDPLMAFLSSGVNAHRDQDIRRALAPLAALAERTDCAIVAIRHLNKATGGSAIYRGGGSIGIIGAARAGLLIAPDPDDEEVRILGSTKSNLAPVAPSLRFQIVDAEGTSRVQWLGESQQSAAEAIAPTPGGEARKWLSEYLAEGPRFATDVEADAEKAGISRKRLRSAREKLGVNVFREGRRQGRSMWSLSTTPPNTHIGQVWASVGKSKKERARVNEHLPTDAHSCPPVEPGKSDEVTLSERAVKVVGDFQSSSTGDHQVSENGSSPPSSSGDHKSGIALMRDLRMRLKTQEVEPGFQVGDRVNAYRGDGTVIGVHDDGRVRVVLDKGRGEAIFRPEQLALLEAVVV